MAIHLLRPETSQHPIDNARATVNSRAMLCLRSGALRSRQVQLLLIRRAVYACYFVLVDGGYFCTAIRERAEHGHPPIVAKVPA
jgi:hypothetical protein